MDGYDDAAARVRQRQQDFEARVERERNDIRTRIARVQFLQEEARRLHIMWQKAENMFASFYAELERLRPQITDELLNDWCFWNLGRTLNGLNQVTKIFDDADADRIRASLKKARMLAQEQAAEERAQVAAEKAAQRAAEEEARRRREAEKTAEAAEAERRAALATARIGGRSKVTPELIAEIKARILASVQILEDELAREFGSTRHLVQAAADQARGELRAEARLAGIVPVEPPKKRSHHSRRDSRDVLAEMADKSPPPAPHADPGEGSPDLQDLATAIHAALARVSRVRSEWIEATLELASRLLQARERLRGNGNFSEWLNANNIKLSHQSRAALIGMGRDLAAARAALETTESWSWERIWAEMSHLTSARKMTESEAPPQILH